MSLTDLSLGIQTHSGKHASRNEGMGVESTLGTGLRSSSAFVARQCWRGSGRLSAFGAASLFGRGFGPLGGGSAVLSNRGTVFG